MGHAPHVGNYCCRGSFFSLSIWRVLYKIFHYVVLCGYLLCGCGCGWVPHRGSLCLSAKPTQRACARDRKRTREDKVPGKNGRKQRRNQSRKESREQHRPGQSIGECSQQKPGEADCLDVCIQRPCWPTWEDESVFLVTLWEFRSNTRSC